MEKIYKSLPLEKDQIRILTLRGSSNPGTKIQCTLKKAFLTDSPKPAYKALSYTWGKGDGGAIFVDAEGMDGKIIEGAQKFFTTANLHGALQQFRKQEGGADLSIWTDAICINQNSSDTEKLSQIGLMRDIFATATETWVWLGPKGHESEKAIDLIKRLSEKVRLDGQSIEYPETIRVDFPKIWGGDIANELIAMEDFFTRDYWFRAWIVQEIAVSHAVTLFCGDSSVPWDDVFNAAYFVDGGVGVRKFILEWRVILARNSGNLRNWATLQSRRDIHSGIQRVVSIQSVRNDIQKVNRIMKELEMNPPDSLLFLLFNHRTTDAEYAVDKYLALAGLIRDSLPPSIENVKDVYTWAALSTASQQQSSVRSGLSLDFLDCGGLPINKTKKFLPGQIFPALPSWVPDWSFHQRRALPLLYWQFSGKRDISRVYFNAPKNLTTQYDPSTTHPVFFTKKLSASPFIDRVQIHPAAAGRSLGQDGLSAWGIQFDEVNGIGFSDWVSFPACNVRNATELPKLPINNYPTGESLEDVVWKTCILNRTARAQKPLLAWKELFYAHISHQTWYHSNRSFRICGRSLEEIALGVLQQTKKKVSGTGATRPSVPLAEPNISLESNPESLDLLSRAFESATGRRRPASTKMRYLCLTPFDAQIGDMIVILSECHAPVVLREEESHYKFIGTCYVHGIMNGEVATMDGLVSKWFDIK